MYENLIIKIVIPLLVVLTTASPSPLPTLIPTRIPTVMPLPTALPTDIPTPLPTVVPASQPESSYESYFDQYSNQYQVNKDLLKQIANCESHFHPDSINGIYAGMFQFAPSTWISTRNDMAADTNPELRFNAEEAIKTAAFKIASGGQSAWANCL